MISNLEKQDIEKNQIIQDPLDIKALANLQESLVRNEMDNMNRKINCPRFDDNLMIKIITFKGDY